MSELPALSPDVTPWEAGLGFAVNLDKGDFLGREALLRAPRDSLSKRFVIFVFPETKLFAWGGEPILREGAPVGEIYSAGYSASLSAMVGMGYVHSTKPETRDEVLCGCYEIEISGERAPTRAMLKAPWPG